MARTRTSATGEAAARRRAAGFTLLEMATALGIVAMIAVLAEPRLEGTAPRLALRAAAETLRADLRATRMAALRGARETTFTIDLAARAWRDDASGRTRAAPEGVVLSVEIARAERLSQGAGRIRFHPEGGATGGTIRLERGGFRATVTVDWFDGSVSVTEARAES